MRPQRRLLILLVCSVVLLDAIVPLSLPLWGRGRGAPAPKQQPKSAITPSRGRSQSAPVPKSRPKSAAGTSSMGAKRPSASQSNYSARFPGASTPSRPSPTGGPRPGGQASVTGRARNTSTANLRPPLACDAHTASCVQNVRAGRRVSCPPSMLQATQASNLSGRPAAESKVAVGRVQRGQRPVLRRHSIGDPSHPPLPHVFQTYQGCFAPGKFEFVKTAEPMTMIRYGSASSRSNGPWMTYTGGRPLGAETVMSILSLPNRPTHYEIVTVPRGTWIMRGPAAPLFGHPGGGEQIYIDRPRELARSERLRLPE